MFVSDMWDKGPRPLASFAQPCFSYAVIYFIKGYTYITSKVRIVLTPSALSKIEIMKRKHSCPHYFFLLPLHDFLYHYKVCIIRLDHICFEKSLSTFCQIRCYAHRTRHSCQKYDEDFLQILWPSSNFNIILARVVKINTVSANFNNPRPSLILNN